MLVYNSDQYDNTDCFAVDYFNIAHTFQQPAAFIVSVYPPDTSTGVAVNTPIYVVFNEQIDPTNITFTVISVGGLFFYPGSFTYDPVASVLSFTHNAYPALLNFSTSYVVAVGGIQDLAGDAVSGTAWTFTTAATGTGGSSKVYHIQINPILRDLKEITLILE